MTIDNTCIGLRGIYPLQEIFLRRKHVHLLLFRYWSQDAREKEFFATLNDHINFVNAYVIVEFVQSMSSWFV